MGAAALALKSLAYKRESLRLSSHGELWEYVDRLIEEVGDREVSRLWRSANSMHINFYSNILTDHRIGFTNKMGNIPILEN